MPIEWEDLPSTVKRYRLDQEQTIETERGEVVPGWDIQEIQCLIQPDRGRLKAASEGLVPIATHNLYCNMQTKQCVSLETDIAEGDSIEDEAGLRYRVEFVADEGGQRDHYKIYLQVIKPGGD